MTVRRVTRFDLVAMSCVKAWWLEGEYQVGSLPKGRPANGCWSYAQEVVA